MDKKDKATGAAVGLNRIIEDSMCIILLFAFPDCILEKVGLYDSMRILICRRNEK